VEGSRRDPQAWLSDVLECISGCELNHIHDLLPWNTAPTADLEDDA